MPGRQFRSALSYGVVAFAACASLAAGLAVVSAAAQSGLPYPCQQIANQGRERIRQMRRKADEEYGVAKNRCGRDLGCYERAKVRRGQAMSAANREEAELSRELRECRAEFEERERRTIRDIQNMGRGQTPAGDPRDGNYERRPDVVPPDASPGGPVWRGPDGRTYEARPDYTPPPRRVYRRAPRRGTNDRAPRTRPTPTYPTTPDGDWDPRSSNGSGSGRTTPDGDWQPPDRTGVPCQEMVDASRARIRQMQDEAAERYRAERKNCGRDLACHNRAKENAARRSREINEEQARRTREIRDCQAGARNRSRSSGGGRTNPYGDWLPGGPPSGNRNGDPCRGLKDFSRERIRRVQNEAAEDYQRERIRCAGGLDCLRRARERSAQRAREIKEEEARLAREIRDCEERHR